jgi:predicted permease
MNTFFRKLSWLSARRRKEAELEEEVRFHLEEDTDERQSAGAAAGDARQAARRELGNTTLLREDARATWGWTFWEQLLRDVRYALRAIRANPTFSAMAILSLALGIGANTAIFSFMDSILVRSLPVSHPQSLALLNWRVQHGRNSLLYRGSGSDGHAIFPYPAYELFQKSTSAVFADVFAYYPADTVNLMVQGQAVLADGEYVSGEYFRTLGVAPAAGRLIVTDDDRAGAPAVAVLSYGFSQKHFADSAQAVGQTVRINGVPFTVAGVAPPEFFGVDPAGSPDFYLPLHSNFLLESKAGPPESLAEQYLDPYNYWIEVMGRLRPGVSLRQAQSTLAPLFYQWANGTARSDKERSNLPQLVVRQGTNGLSTLRRAYSKPLYVLLGMVGLILAIACANIASLLLARSAARRREIAVRLSIGGTRWRIIRQLLTESLVLSSLGGIAGVLFAIWGMRFITLLLANGQEDFTLRAELNWHVLAVAAALSIVTGILFGLAPALESTRPGVMPALKRVRAAEAHSRSRVSLGRILLAGQIAISLLMLVAAGLFVRTLSNLQAIQLGFNRENILLFELNARQAGHNDPEIVSWYSDLQKRFSAIPGVRAASLSHMPLVGHGSWFSAVTPAGKQPKPGELTHILQVGQGYLTTMQIPLLAGRDIDERDRPGSPRVAIVNETWAKSHFGDENPMGRRIAFEEENPSLRQEIEIVGVARDARYGGHLTEAFQPVVYLPFTQPHFPVQKMTFALRTTGNPSAHATTIRDLVRQADPRVPVADIRTQAADVDRVMNQEIIFARLGSGFALLALLIACVGLYGAMSYTVARRTGEIGIRMALGAPRGSVVWMVLREVLALAVAGLAIGVPACLLASKLVKSFLFGLEPNDSLAISVAVATLLAASLAAGYAPALRASRIEPTVALRHE